MGIGKGRKIWPFNPLDKFRCGWICIASLLGLQIAKTLFLFRGVDLSVPFPVVNVDFITYWARATRTHIFLQRCGQNWGYDPFQMGGYVTIETGGIFLNLVPAYFSSLMPIWKSLLFLEFSFFLLVPLIFGLSVYGALKDPWISCIAGAIVVFMYGWFEPFTRLFITVGAFAFQMATVVGFLQMASFWRWLKEGKWSYWCGMAALTAFVFQLHPLGLILVGPACCLLYFSRISRLNRIQHLQMLLAFALVLAVNLNWIWPYLVFKDWISTTPFLETRGWRQFLGSINFWDGDFHSKSAGSFNFMMLIFALRTIKFFCYESVRKAAFYAVLAFFFWILGHFGTSLLFFENLQPLRFTLPFWMLAYGLASVSIYPLLRLSAGVLLACIFIGLGATGLIASASNPYWFKLTNRMPAYQLEFMEFLKRNPQPGRLLVETQEIGMPHFFDVVPLATAQPLIGGPYGAGYLTTQFSNFHTSYKYGQRPVIFNKYLDQLNEADFFSYLHLYNITAIAVGSDKARSLLERYKNVLALQGAAGGHTWYNVKIRPDWFYKGGGKLSLNYDSIALKDVSKGPVILKLHWAKTLKSDPPLNLEPVYLLDDPVPFIGFVNSTDRQDILIYNNRGISVPL